MSPSHANGLKSPNEVLLRWFNQYFRWYQPSFVQALTADLRPDWGGVYAYGCRAYPLQNARQKGAQKRAFKTRPRAHIGYLVGYDASNIYRIWVPQLKKVISTRDVTFDERTFYQGAEERSPQAIEIARNAVELIELPIVIEGSGMLAERPANPTMEQNTPEEVAGGLGGVETASPGQDSGVEALGTPSPRDTSGESTSNAEDDVPDAGLLTPEDTPEPQSETGQEDGGESNDNNTLGEGLESAAEAQQGDGNGSEEPANKRKYVRKVWGPPTRASTRKRGPGPGAGGAASRIVGFNMPLYQDDGIHTPEQRAWQTFCETFLPEVETALHEGDARHRTFHSVISAAVQQPREGRPSATPSRPRVRFEDLARAPKAWKDLENHHMREQFEKAARAEIDNLVAKGTWKQIPREQARSKPIPLKWVFTYKFDKDGLLDKCKARICVRGDLQKLDTLQSTYAATLAARSFRTMMALAAQFDLEVKQFDVAQAFLNAELPGGVVCELPDGFREPGKVVELQKALYGLRESPLLWYKEFSGTLQGLGLVSSAEEPCLFLTPDRHVLVLFYVDDYLVFYHKEHQEQANSIMAALKAKYELHEQGDVAWFLGIRVLRDRAARKVWLSHDQYLEKIAKRFGLTEGPFSSVPLPGTDLVRFEGTATRAQVKEYQELVGSVLYGAVMIRADIAYPAALLSQFLTNPGPEHVSAAKQAIQYAYATRFLAIQYGGENATQVLLMAGDASFADDPETRRSAQGYLIMLFGGLVNWKSARQNTVTTSSTEAELLALTDLGRETMAFKRFLRDLRLELGLPWTIFCDNQQTIRLVVGANERISTRLRHVDIHNLWARQEHAKGSFEVAYLPTAQMPADGLTKRLSRQKFEHFRALLNLQDISHIIEARQGSEAELVNLGTEPRATEKI